MLEVKKYFWCSFSQCNNRALTWDPNNNTFYFQTYTSKGHINWEEHWKQTKMSKYTLSLLQVYDCFLCSVFFFRHFEHWESICKWVSPINAMWQNDQNILLAQIIIHMEPYTAARLITLVHNQAKKTLYDCFLFLFFWKAENARIFLEHLLLRSFCM